MRKYHIMIAALIVLCDRMTKWLVSQKITLHDSIDIVPGMFRLTHVQNQGAAFGLFAESPSEWRVAMLILFSLAALWRRAGQSVGPRNQRACDRLHRLLSRRASLAGI